MWACGPRAPLSPSQTPPGWACTTTLSPCHWLASCPHVLTGRRAEVGVAVQSTTRLVWCRVNGRVGFVKGTLYYAQATGMTMHLPG